MVYAYARKVETYLAANILTRTRPDLSDHHKAEDADLQESV